MDNHSTTTVAVPITATKILKLNNLMALWIATAAANLADGIFKLALPLLALQITQSPGLIAGVAFTVRLPWLLFALFAGVISDRFDRRRIMINANSLRVIILMVLVGLMLLDMTSLSLIYLMAFVLGIAETLADTAGSSILPAIVEPEKLEQANAWLVGAVTVTNEFIGPPLGGALAAIGLVLAFGASSALYLVAVVCLLMIAGSFRPKRAVNARLREELVVGLRFVWHDGLLRTLAIIVAVMNFGWSAWAAVMVVYVVKPGPGGLSEFGYGLMLTSIGIGGAIGALVAVPLVTRLGRRWAIGADIVGTFLMLAMPAVTANAWAIGAVAILGGIGGSMWSIVVSSIRQQIVPDDMLGRTSGVFRLFGYGSLPIGAAVAGIIAEGVGLQAVFAFCAILTALLIFPFMRNIVPADLDQRQTTPSV